MDEEFQSLIVTNPDLVDEGIDVSSLRTTTDTSPFLLGNIPDYQGIQYSTLAPTKYSDLMRLYSSGLPTLDIPQAVTPPSDGGSGDGGQDLGIPTRVPVAPETSVEAITNVDTPLTQMITDPVTGQTQTVKQAMTENAAYTGTTSDPFLVSGAAGGARLPTTPANTDIMVEDLSEPFADERGITGKRVSYPGDQSGVIKGAIDPQPVRTILAPDGITYDAVTGQPIYEDLDAQAAATDLALGTQDFVTEEDLANNTGLLQKLGLPADFNIKRAALEAGINLAVGVPISLIARGLGVVLPDRDPRQNALEEMYDVKDGTIQSGLMKDYNPVSGNPLDPTYGLQDAYQKRIDTINKTLGGMTLEQYQNTDLVQRKKDLEEAMAKEKAMLDQLQYGDPEKIAAGIQTADDDSGSEMLDTSTGVTQPFDADTFDDDVTLTSTPPTGTITPLEDDFEFTTTLPPDRTTGPIELSDMSREEMMEFANELPGTEGLDLIQAYNDLQEYESDLEEIGKDVDYIGYTEQEKADIAAGKKTPELGELIDFGLDETIGKPPDTSNVVEDIGIENIQENIDRATDQDIIDRGGGDNISTGGLDPNRGQQVDRGSSGAGDNQPVTTTTKPGELKTSTYDAELEDDRDTGGGGNTGGKSIVCTAMYQTTGLEDWSKAMKIWYIYQKKYLTIQHQEGYHKLFKPFVKGMHKNKIIKVIGAHVAKHRTQDLKHIMFGSKSSWLGRLYRKILEPICYIVGKYAK
jgi:hypothetical protein